MFVSGWGGGQGENNDSANREERGRNFIWGDNESDFRCVQWACVEGAHILSSKHGTQGSFPGKHSASAFTAYQAAGALNYVCEHLCFLSIYFVHLLTRCVQSYQKSLRDVFLEVWECWKLFPYKLMVTLLHHFGLQILTGMLYLGMAGEPVIETPTRVKRRRTWKWR